MKELIAHFSDRRTGILPNTHHHRTRCAKECPVPGGVCGTTEWTNKVKDRIREVNFPFTDRQTDILTDKDAH